MDNVPAFDPLNPFPIYAYMRKTHPVFNGPTPDAWQIFRYEDALRVINAPAEFSSDIFGGLPER